MFRALRAFLPSLSSLSLSHCSIVEGRARSPSPHVLPPSSFIHAKRIQKMDDEAMDDFFLQGLPGLVTLKRLTLCHIKGLSDGRLENLSSLTRLTSLELNSLSNHKVTHASLPRVLGALPTPNLGSLPSLPTLKHLEHLSWFVGDLLDESVPFSCLSGLPRLYTFSVPTNLFYRINRWYRDLESLLPPYCELETSSG